MREQITKPANDITPRAVMLDHGLPSTSRSILIVQRPEVLASIVVTMGRWAVFLPGLSPDTDFHARLASHEPWPPRDTLSGLSATWPTRPELAFDWLDIA